MKYSVLAGLSLGLSATLTCHAQAADPAQLLQRMNECRQQFGTSEAVNQCATVCFQSYQRFARNPALTRSDPAWSACTSAHETALGGGDKPSAAGATEAPATTVPVASQAGSGSLPGLVSSRQEMLQLMERHAAECADLYRATKVTESSNCAMTCSDRASRIRFRPNDPLSTAQEHFAECSDAYEQAMHRDTQRQADAATNAARIQSIVAGGVPEHALELARRNRRFCEEGNTPYVNYDCACIEREYPGAWSAVWERGLTTFFNEERPTMLSRIRTLKDRGAGKLRIAQTEDNLQRQEEAIVDGRQGLAGPPDLAACIDRDKMAARIGAECEVPPGSAQTRQDFCGCYVDEVIAGLVAPGNPNMTGEDKFTRLARGECYVPQ